VYFSVAKNPSIMRWGRRSAFIVALSRLDLKE
jgi:hypothetical protein